MKKIYNMLLSFVLLSTLSCEIHAGRNVFQEAWLKLVYNKDYIVGGGAVIAGSYFSPKYTVIATGIVASYMTVKARYELWKIKQRYYQSDRSEREWAMPHAVESSLLARWRQNNQFGDGIFWPTAFWMKEDVRVVQSNLLRDMRAGKLLITNQSGTVITSPTLADVLAAIKREMKQLAKDLKFISYYTNVSATYLQPEEFEAETGLAQILWPNYNMASELFVELDLLLKRLDALREIVAIM